MDDLKAESSLQSLNEWLSTNGELEAKTTAENWNINPFEDALLFSPSSQSRSNRLYLVRDGVVIAFSPSVTSFDDAYSLLENS